MKNGIYFLLLLLINFSALYIGGLSTAPGVTSNWYIQLNKAPWTPPGFVFGISWTIVMITFAWFISGMLTFSPSIKSVLGLFIIQWILNVAWNPMFFTYHKTGISVLILFFLFLCLLGLFYNALSANLPFIYTVALAPYMLWLLIATSLNLYIFIRN